MPDRIDPTEWTAELDLMRRLVVGIREVSEISGVPQRQLRYWQQKGIIQPVNPDCTVRKFDYLNIKRILLIKELLDEGYTLDAAAGKVAARIQRLNEAFTRLHAASGEPPEEPEA